MKNTLLGIFSIFCVQLFAQNQPPAILNVSSAQNAKTVTYNFTLEDDENDVCTVELHVFKKSGSGFEPLTVNGITGDIGNNISTGTKAISVPLPSDGEYRINIVAYDAHSFDLQAIVDRVDTLHLYSDLKWLEGTRHRTAGAAKLKAVQDSIEGLFTSLHYEPSIHTAKFGDYQLKNYIADHYGASSPGRILINDAHYDCVPFGPGADDNATGVAGMMEISRIIADYHFRKSIRFIGFDVEEDGLIGSKAYVGQGGLSVKDTIEGVLNFEMIGYYSDKPNSQTLPNGFNLLFPAQSAAIAADSYKGNFITNVRNSNSKGISDAFEKSATTYVPELKVVTLEVPGNGALTPDLLRSDHASFWTAGKPALMLTDGANFRNKNYHTANDRVDSLNMWFMGNVVKASLGALLEEANIIHGDVYSSDLQVLTAVDQLPGISVEIFPNPVNEILHITSQNAGNCTVDIQTLSGELIFNKKYDSEASGKIEIGTSKWPAATYLVKFETEQGTILRKIVKN